MGSVLQTGLYQGLRPVAVLVPPLPVSCGRAQHRLARPPFGRPCAEIESETRRTRDPDTSAWQTAGQISAALADGMSRF